MRKKLCVGILLVVIFFVSYIGFRFYKTKEASNSYKPHMFDLEQVEDGEYEGKSDFGLVNVRVLV